MSFAAILGLLPVVFQLALKIMDVLIKTPAEKVEDVLRSFNALIVEVQEGLDHAKKTDGDTSKLEDAINRRLRR